jgi:hypothetical protein
MTTLTYNLQDNDQSSASFYHDLDKFAGQVVAYPDRLLHQTATSMKLRSDQQAASQSRTEKEYFFVVADVWGALEQLSFHGSSGGRVPAASVEATL